ncbi:uncharacterized protein L3040_006348 [Drepanopeziza brunnea f. sp. 'multigermtubi']|uniref:uncharacterized protein n=1 Tax=Drepanopeziza brunnea f. sp. 'multigermtubi' TaxID=698441 RepID=UPI0023A49E9C|nr:hypothetical protein L3040_006348 [Drepanopeziza brunnea f. sp. 'multigermtubi']
MNSRRREKFVLPGVPPEKYQEATFGLHVYQPGAGNVRIHNASITSSSSNIHSPFFGPRFGIPRSQPVSATVFRLATGVRHDHHPHSEHGRPGIEPRPSLSLAPVHACDVCFEDFSSETQPPEWITRACVHKPTICSRCLAAYIESELNSKIAERIYCPESNCGAVLDHGDIKRLAADAETFARYDTRLLRRALGADRNAVWCQNCASGQIHEGGSTQPIVRCSNCHFRSCFRHGVPWHDRLTCEEYDAMLLNPEGFQAAIDRDDAASAAEMKRLEAEDRLAKAAERQAREAEMERQRQAAAATRREDLRRRLVEEKLSLAKISATTKNCPGCQGPIELIPGACKHMISPMRGVDPFAVADISSQKAMSAIMDVSLVSRCKLT